MGTPKIQSIQRAFDVLEVLWQLNGAGPTEVADVMNIHKSTAHVYLRSLASTGYVINNDGTYELSYQFLTMGSRLKHRSHIFQASRNELNRLAAATGELPTIVIKEDKYVIILHQIPGDNSLDLGTYSGMQTPIHTTAAGKAILANLPRAQIELILDNGLEAVTDQTVTDPDRLRDQLKQIRSDGFAVDYDQQVVGMGVIAVPILVDDELIASLGIAVPTERLRNESHREELLQQLRESLDRITIKYKYGK